MRVVNQQVPTPFRDIDARHGAAAEPPRVRQEGRAAAAAQLARLARQLAAQLAPVSRDGRRARPRRGAAVGPLLRRGHRELRARRALGPRPHATTSARSSTSSTSRRPTSTPASGSSSAPTAGTTCRSRRAVARLDGAADGLQARPRPRPRAHRRRHHLDDERRHRRRGGGEARRRRQPARAVRQRLLEGRSRRRSARARAACQRHGLPADRLPGVQAAGLPAPARDGARTGRSATPASTSS